MTRLKLAEARPNMPIHRRSDLNGQVEVAAVAPDRPMPQAAPATPEQIAEAQRRFEICKTCEHSSDGGFACELYQGCCLGRFRAVAGNHCPTAKW